MSLSVEQQADLASLLYELGHNPQTRAGLAQLVHRVDPARAKASFPDIVQEARFQALERKVADHLDVKGAKAAQARYEAQKEKLRDKYSDEQLAAIEKEMTRIGTPDWEAGAVLYAAKHPEQDPRYAPPRPDERPGATWEFPTVTGGDGKPMAFKDFAADPRKHSLNTAYNIISEFKNQRLSNAFRG